MALDKLGLIHTASRAEPNRTDSAWKTNLRYEMEAFALHAEPNQTERVPWLMFVFTRQPILLRNRSNFLGLKCVCTQICLFLVNKRLLHQILPINENTRTSFDILAVQKCQLQWFQFGSGRLGLARLSLQCEWGLKVCMQPEGPATCQQNQGCWCFSSALQQPANRIKVAGAFPQPYSKYWTSTKTPYCTVCFLSTAL